MREVDSCQGNIRESVQSQEKVRGVIEKSRQGMFTTNVMFEVTSVFSILLHALFRLVLKFFCSDINISNDVGNLAWVGNVQEFHKARRVDSLWGTTGKQT